MKETVRELSVKDRELLKKLQDAGVLHPVRQNPIGEDGEAILVTCACKPYHEMLMYQLLQSGQGSPGPRIFSLSWLGGILLCSQTSPLSRRPGDDDRFSSELTEMQKVTGINLALSCIHAPCAVIENAGVSLEKAIDHQLGAKGRIKMSNRKLKMGCFLEVELSESSKEVYFLTRTSWDKYQRRRARSPIK